MEEEDWSHFADDTPHREDDALFASFADTQPRISLSEVKAQIDREQTVALKDVVAFNAKPQQAFTATKYPNGFSLACH
jgi:hypothetical protein